MILSDCSGERKYLGSGDSSKMSDNEHPFSVLWNPEILAVTHLPLEVIPQVIKRGEDDAEGASSVVTEESFDVLKEAILRLSIFEYPSDVKKERASCVVKSPSIACHREGLAGESSNKEVVLGDVACWDCSNISPVNPSGEVVIVNVGCMLVIFVSPDNLMAIPFYFEVEASYPCKK